MRSVSTSLLNCSSWYWVVKGYSLYHGDVFLAHFDCADDEVQFDLRQPLVIPFLWFASGLWLPIW